MISKTEQVANLRKARASRAESAAKPARRPVSQPKGTRAGKTKGAKKARSPAAATSPKGHAREGSKLEVIAGLLTRPEGCTAKEILKATEWPAVSVPQQARALGVKLKTKKEGRALRYWAA